MTDKKNYIIDHLKLRGRLTRSVGIARDLNDPLAIDGYVVTRSVKETAKSIGAVLRKSNTQKAWRITGPYGSGKSALGLFLCQLVRGPKISGKAFELLQGEAGELNDQWRPGLGWLPVVVSGARRPILSCLADALINSLEELTSASSRTAVHRLLSAAADPAHAHEVTVEQILDAFTQFALSKGVNGIFIVFDELGKCLEYAALNPRDGDLFALQQLAEATYGQTVCPIAVVTLVHQHFEEYASSISATVSDEWSKVSSRFQEIAFDEPIEQYLSFAADTLGPDTVLSNSKELKQAAVAKLDALFEGKDKQDGGRKKWLLKLAQRLYPLHPACALALPYIFKKFAQSERSLFAFLTEDSVASLRSFCSKEVISPSNWYEFPELYDYLTQFTLRFRNPDTQRKWDLVQYTVSAGALTEVEARIIKAIGIVECCGPIPGLSSHKNMLQAYLSDDPQSIFAAIEGLVSQGVVVRRQDSGEYQLATESTIRLDTLMSEAKHSISTIDNITLGLKRTVGKTVVAHRHFHQTGTLRQIELQFGVIDNEKIRHQKHAANCDGSILILLCAQDRSPIELSDIVTSSELSCTGSALVRIAKLAPEKLQSLEALSLWVRVGEMAQMQAADNWLMRYINQQIADAETIVRRDVIQTLDNAADSDLSPWLHLGKTIPNESNWNLSQAASWLSDYLYPSAPRVRNELINRNKLSSQLALARQNLVEAMMEAPERDGLGITGYPPERAIYGAMLKLSGIHQPDAKPGLPKFAPPTKDDTHNFQPAWARLDEMVREHGVVELAHLLSELAKAPYGIRNGVSTVLLATYLIGNIKEVALFERGTLVIEPTGDHFARLFKNPKNFTVRALKKRETESDYLRQLAAGIRLFSEQAEAIDPMSLTRVLVRWQFRLSSYAANTLTISKNAKALRASIKRATDPMALLYEALPESVDGVIDGVKLKETINALDAAINEIAASDRKLREAAAVELGEAFGLKGALSGIRLALARECQAPRQTAVDYKLKAFITRCIDQTLTDEKWLESIAGVVTERSMDNWTDETIGTFSTGIRGLAGQLRRWMDLMINHGQTVSGAERLLRIAITDGAGQEFREVFYRDELSDETKNKALQALRDATGIPEEELGTLLASLYLDRTNLKTNVIEGGEQHG